VWGGGVWGGVWGFLLGGGGGGGGGSVGAIKKTSNFTRIPGTTSRGGGKTPKDSFVSGLFFLP